MVNMAGKAREREDQQRALQRFKEALEDLTFNSKPLIDDLTRAADSSEAQAPRIVEIIESRLMQARLDWKLPSLYLLDSIMKNLRGVYLEEISKILVSIFCHCFEKLVEPEPRKALYKLRLTWTPFVPMRKLAAIDRHVHALDPHWPVLATDASGPSSPTIFVNPKFLEAGPSKTVASNASSASKQPKRPSPPNIEGEKIPSTVGLKRIPKKTSKSPSKSPPKVVVTGGKGSSEMPTLSIQDRRKQILRQVTSKKKAISSSLSAAAVDGDVASMPRQQKSQSLKRSLSPSPVSNRRAHSKSPKRPRSTSPIETNSPVKKRKRPIQKLVSVSVKTQEDIPPPVKQIKVEPDAESADIKDKKKKKKKKCESTLLKKSQLQLDDLPPELLPKHQERIKIKVEEQRASGSISEKEHETVVQQLDKLYELQELKKKSGSEGSGGSPPPLSTDSASDSSSRTQPQTQSRENDSRTSKNVPQLHTMSSKGNSTRSDHFNDPDRPPGFRDRGRGRMHRGRPPRHLLPTPFDPSYPPDDRNFPHGPPPPPPPHGHPDYYRGRPPRRGGFRPPRGGPPPGWMERGRGRYYDGPPHGRGRALPGPPPPHWHEPMDMEHNGPLPPHHLPPSHGPPPPPDMLPPPGPEGHGPPPSNHPPNEGDSTNVSALLSKLVDAGLIGDKGSDNAPAAAVPGPGPGPGPIPGPGSSHEGGAQGSRVTPPHMLRQTPPPPISVPRLGLTPATLKQRYTILITLLNSGVPCTSCGMRFKSESAEEYRRHLDWHYQINRQEKEGTGKTSRNWYMHPEDWLTFEELAHDNNEKELTLEPQLPDKDFREKSEQPAPLSEHDQTSCRVLEGETSDEVCSICQEPLEQFWEENEEEWHFKDAVRNDAGKLFHVFCYKDAKESGALDTSGSQLPSPVEVKETDPFDSA